MMEVMTQTYTKKIIVTDENTTPEKRAERLRRVRNLANLSRKAMTEHSTLNVNTLKAWELGRYGGLPRDGAQKVIDRVTREGVVCNLDWLLYGKGLGPQVTHNDSLVSDTDTISLNEAQKIAEECLLFKKHYPDAIEYHVIDDGMSPQFDISDVVLAAEKYQQLTPSLQGKNCIVQLNDGRLLLRNCRLTHDSKINLVCLNPNTTVDEPLIHNAHISFIAPVIWHRKNQH